MHLLGMHSYSNRLIQPAPAGVKRLPGHIARAAAAGSMSSAHAAPTEYYRHGMTSLGGVTMEQALQRLGGEEAAVEVVRPMPPSSFVRPQSINYTLDGKQRRWDMVESHPSVAVLLYHTSLHAFLLVRQFRPAVYVSTLREAEAEGLPLPTLSQAFTYELCAGIIDKPHLNLKEITREEIAEECGYDVPVSAIHEVTSFISAIGISGARQTIFAAEVDDGMALHNGGGLLDHGEAIEVLALPVAQANAFLFDTSLAKSAGLMFSLTWAQEQLRRNSGRLFPPSP